MWIVKLALNRPYTFLVAALLILILSPVLIFVIGMPVDIFPNINIPVVSIIWNYTGFSPQQMEQRIVSITERALTTTVNDIEHIESQSLNGIAVVKVYFHPSVKIDMAVAQITAISQTQLRQLPAGTTPPLVLQYSASSVPIVQLSTSSKTLSEQDLNDLSLNFIRPRLTTIQGASVPYPYGGKQRQVQVDIDIPKLQARGLTPIDVVNALGTQNLILPSGTAKIGPLEYDIGMNGAPATVEELNNLPIKSVNGALIYIRDVAHVRDGFSPQTNIVRQDGLRSTLISILKNGNVSTLDIVQNVKNLVPRLMPTLPPDLQIKPLFDQSIFVRAAIWGVVKEGCIAALLTALMILLFLGDWKSTLIIAISIPLSILSSLICLDALGETINIMTLGGLALAVGILVDDATVTIENIDNHLSRGEKLHDGILNGASQIAVPALVSSLCICIVFVPMFLLSGVARYLFVPLAESVVFAVMASYVLSRTLVPTLAMYLLKGHDGKVHDDREDGPAEARARASHAGGDVHKGPRGINQGTEAYHGPAKIQREGGVHYGEPAVAQQVMASAEEARLFRPVPAEIRGRVRTPAPHLHAHARSRPFALVAFRHRLPHALPWQPRAHSVSRAGLLSHGRRRRIQAAHPRQDRHPRRGNRAALRPNRGGHPQENPRKGSRGHPRQHWPALQRHQSLLLQFRRDRHGGRRHPRLAQARPQAHGRIPAPVAHRAAEGISRHALHVPAGRYRQPDSQLRPARADRHPVYRQPRAPEPRSRAQGGRADQPRARRGRRQRAPDLRRAADQPHDGPLAGGEGRHHRATDFPKRARRAQRQLPDLAHVLPRSEEWRELQRRGPDAAIQHQLAAGSREPPATRHEQFAGAGEPRRDQPRFGGGRDLPLRHPSRHRRLRERAGPRPRRCVGRREQDHGRRGQGDSEGHRYGCARPGADDAAVVPGPLRGSRRRHRARLPAHGRELPVVVGAVHHHHGAARRTRGHRLDARHHRHDAERPGTDGRDHVHRRRDGKQHPRHLLRARTARRGEGRAPGRARGGHDTPAPGHHDRAGHDHRHGAHGARPRRRRRAERAARPRGNRRAAGGHHRDALFRTRRLQHHPPPDREKEPGHDSTSAEKNEPAPAGQPGYTS